MRQRIEELEDAIQKNSLVGIYSVFYTIAHGDPNFSTGKFWDVFSYVKSKNISGFLQEFDGEEFQEEDKWDEEYWAYIASSLIDNFCEERIRHLEKVGKKLYPNQRIEQAMVSTNSAQKKTESPSNVIQPSIQVQGNRNKKLNLPILIAVAAVALILLGVFVKLLLK